MLDEKRFYDIGARFMLLIINSQYLVFFRAKWLTQNIQYQSKYFSSGVLAKTNILLNCYNGI